MKFFLVIAPVAVVSFGLGLALGRSGTPKRPEAPVVPARRSEAQKTPPRSSDRMSVPSTEPPARAPEVPIKAEKPASKPSIPYDFVSALAEAKSWSVREAAVIRLSKEDVGRHKELLVGLVASESEVYAVKFTAMDKLVDGTLKTALAGWTARSLADRLPLERNDNFRAAILNKLGALAVWDPQESGFVISLLGRAMVDEPSAEVRRSAVGSISMLAPDQALPYVLAARTRESDPRIQNEIEVVIKVLEKRKAAQR
jgi:hypothetical protein